ncbi:hypothetical protein NDR87_36260 [Nocardia sp. CDC159]|uniref:Uncharacterized protein n=1 Tax=Nocardia pulmonis TaxID=2951408 RepID=A0A9X2J288_9NOCA|nr:MULTISPECIES: hypothetical protein [Nocardia]MCM6778915.1 hypothetical protein [Nocardia pulmonis]MCM6791832.1 hypothetical protein [Nocardia sp. CDC159]
MTLRKLLRLATHLTPGIYAIGWGYHIDASMVVVNHLRHEIADETDRRNGRRLSASERRTWRALEKSLRGAK